MMIVTRDNDPVRAGEPRSVRPRHRWPSLMLAMLVWLPGHWPTEARAQASRTEDVKLIVSDGISNDFFGSSVALAGDRAIIGAAQDQSDDGRLAGAAYVFERDGQGGWTEVVKLTASDGAGHNGFGDSVAYVADRAIIVGAPGDDNANGRSAGAAYVFETDGRSGWTEVAKLTASDGARYESFGTAVALAGERAIIGADDHDSEVRFDGVGAAYVFERDDRGGWTEVAKLTASDGARGDNFGGAVAIAGDRVVVGARRDGNDRGLLAGAAYVFEPDGQGEWMETAKLTASDGARWDRLGGAVAIAGDRIVLGVEDDNTEIGVVNFESGSVYVFESDERGRWTETAKLTASDAAPGSRFGTAVAIASDRVLVGANGELNEGVFNAGAAYLFEPDGQGGWTETAKLMASDRSQSDLLGSSVALSGDRAIAGAPFKGEFVDDVSVPFNTGAAYVFDFAESSDGDGVSDAADHCPATVVPEAHVPAFGHLWGRRFALVGKRDGDGAALFTNRHDRALFSSERTRGCSCEQILVQRARHLDLRDSEAVFQLFDQWFGGCYRSTLRRFGRGDGS